MSRFVDKGAIVAAYVGIGMALVIGVSFLLVIPIEPVYWLLAPLSGLLIGYYANTRSERQAGPWSRILVNGTFAGLVTGLTMAALLLGVKALFFAADDGYRDASLGAPLTCQTGAPCVYARYLDQPGAAAKLESQGVTDVVVVHRVLLEPAVQHGGDAPAHHHRRRVRRRLPLRPRPPQAALDGRLDPAPRQT